MTNTVNPSMGKARVPQPQNGGFDLQTLIDLVLSSWKWMLLSVIVCVGAAYYYVSTIAPVYERASVLLVKEEQESGLKELSALMNNPGASTSKGIENEIYTLSSNQVLSEVVDRLKLDIIYTQKRGFRTVDLYGEVPFEVRFENAFSGAVSLEVKAISSDSLYVSAFRVSGENIEKSMWIPYNQKVSTPVGNLVIVPKGVPSKQQLEQPYVVHRMDKEYVVSVLRSKITTAPALENGTMVKIVCLDTSIPKADAILKSIMDVYTEILVEDKNKTAANTAKFIEERIVIISKELGAVEEELTEFKQRQGIVDIQSKVESSMEEGTRAKEKSLELTAQLNVAQYVRNFVNDISKRNELIPNVSGIGDTGVESQIQSYNELLLRRNRLEENSGKDNVVVQELNQDLMAMRSTIAGSLETYCKTISLRISDARKQESRANSSISALPLQEKKVLDVMRQQAIKENLYTFLLQNREQIAMQLASTEANLRVVEQPYGSKLPVYPNKKQILLIALAVGLALPVGLAYLRKLLDTGVDGKKDIERFTTIPVIGEIPTQQAKSDAKIVVAANCKDSVNEAFRILRANLSFFYSDAKVIMLTSTMAGEGKSFVSRNIAAALALSGKKVVLVDTDIRKGTLGKLLDIKYENGLSTYLSGHTPAYRELIIPNILDTQIDFLPAGMVPPNPAELLMGDRLEMLVADLRQSYDYVILDNVPAMVVADAGLVNRVADITLYVVRNGVLDRRYLPELEKIYAENKFKQLSIVLNDVPMAHKYGYSYGYGYGYGYHADGHSAQQHSAASRKSFKKKIFKKR